jgi:hypothetical protein
MGIDYDIPLEDYHRAKLLSTTKLSDFASRGPRYFYNRYVVGTAKPFESSEAQDLGQAFEDLVCLERAHFDARYAIKPEGMNFATKDGKAWREEHSSKVILKADDVDMLHLMRESLMQNDAAASLVQASKQQATVRAEYDGTPGIQSRPDFLCLDGTLVTGYQPATADLKTTLTLGKLTSGRSVQEYRYHAQAALCAKTLEANGVQTRNFLIACEKVAPYRCVVVEVTEDWLRAGWSWCERQLNGLATHYRTNMWPLVDREVISLPPPPPWVTQTNDDAEDAA